MKNYKRAITVFSMLLCFGLFAQGPPGGGQGGRGGQGQGKSQERGGRPDASQILSILDTNNDNLIDIDEASKDKRGRIAEDFDEIDTNDDKYMDIEELEVSLSDRKPKKVSAKKLIKEIDDNNDGTLNELEVAASEKIEISKNFSKIDTNQDNELDIEELNNFYAENDKSTRKKRK